MEKSTYTGVCMLYIYYLYIRVHQGYDRKVELATVFARTVPVLTESLELLYLFVFAAFPDAEKRDWKSVRLN